MSSSAARAWRFTVGAGLCRTLGSAVATLWRLAAVMATASLRSSAAIEQEVRNTARSGNIEEKTNSVHQASSGSAKRKEVVARNQEVSGSAGARSIKVQASPLHAAASARVQEFRRSARHELRPPIFGKLLSQCRCASCATGSRFGLPSKALPNPSIRPSPNSKTPGPRCSACHHLQRGPGVLLSVPAYVER